jgi:biopolymer transport protein ExbD
MARLEQDDEEVKADMTPMIDVIFLLLIFFILTTKFIPEEKIIASILPNKGSSSAQTQEEEQLDPVKVRIYPASMTVGLGPQQLDQMWHEDRDSAQVVVKIGNTDTGVIIDGLKLGSRNADESEGELEKIHGYVNQALLAVEGLAAPNPRSEQATVEIHAFSGLPWKYALSSYDAVRQYETNQMAAQGIQVAQDDLEGARR